MDLSCFLENPFDAGKTSVAELIAFTTDHLQRMVTHDDDGAFTARITATSTALGHLEDVSEAKAKLGLRKARKQMKDDFHQSLADRVARIGAVVAKKYGDDSPELVGCLPNGFAVISTCRDDQVAAHLQTLVDAVTELQPGLGLASLTEALHLLAAWTTLHQATEISTTRKPSTPENRNATRADLQGVLFVNLLEIAKMFPGQPENLGHYMRQEMLGDSFEV